MGRSERARLAALNGGQFGRFLRENALRILFGMTDTAFWI
jgi:hypothetical protein